MKENSILTREHTPTKELQQTVETTFKGLSLLYTEVYYLDHEVDENTGIIDSEKKVPHYTKDQVDRNRKSLKSAYMVAKGAAAPEEIISFRKKYHIAASTLSLILGFSKNTISNIEKEGVHSLPTGRLIKLCLTNTDILLQYIHTYSSLEEHKKNALVKSLTA